VNLQKLWEKSLISLLVQTRPTETVLFQRAAAMSISWILMHSRWLSQTLRFSASHSWCLLLIQVLVALASSPFTIFHTLPRMSSLVRCSTNHLDKMFYLSSPQIMICWTNKYTSTSVSLTQTRNSMQQLMLVTNSCQQVETPFQRYLSSMHAQFPAQISCLRLVLASMAKVSKIIWSTTMLKLASCGVILATWPQS